MRACLAPTCGGHRGATNQINHVNDNLKAKISALPDKPGCYMMRDRSGKIIYVGKARSLRKRVQSYFRTSTLKRAEPKLRALIDAVEDLDTMTLRDEAEALLTESRLVREYRPHYNVLLRDDKRFLAIRANHKSRIPRFQLCRMKRSDGAEYFGPFPSATVARTAVDYVEKRFGIRRCSPTVPDAETYRHCNDDVIRFCAAPCIQKIPAEEYAARFEQACAVLRGETTNTLAEIRQQMSEAAASLDFERAAALRDTMFSLKTVMENRSRMLSTPAMKRDDAHDGVRELAEHLSLPAPPTVIECFDISNISGTLAVASMVCAVDGMPRGQRYRHYRIQSVEGIDDPRMIAEVVSRRYRRLLDEQSPLPDLLVVDGGITQLRAARAALKEIGIETMPSIGLAKQFEEIVMDNGEPPLRLPHDTAALRVLQRLRDEAHRFAITYNRNLRRKKVRESVLDEIPGIGAERKMQILKHFGSTRRLSAATPEQIAEVPGIGPAMAATIHSSLNGQV